MCAIDGADGSEVSVHHTYMVKSARKDHKCSECRRVIPKGESYRRDEMVMEGGWFHFQTCVHCQIACAWLADQCGGWLHEGVQEDIQEHTEVYRIARLYRLEIGIRRKWLRFDNSGLMPIPQKPMVMIVDDKLAGGFTAQDHAQMGE